MKKCFLIVFVSFQFTSLSQNIKIYEKPPVFIGCEDQAIDILKNCFNTKLNQYVFENFQISEEAINDNYKGEVKVLFEVDREGHIKVVYVDAIYEALKEETKRVFQTLPKIQPGTYNGNPTFYQYSLAIKIPLVDPNDMKNTASEAEVQLKKFVDLNEIVSNDFDSITNNIVK